jgi:hypothetical protein
MIEINDAYMSTHTLKSYKKKLKRGKGRQKNTKVSVMAESFPLEDENGNRSNFCGNFKMKVNPEEYKESMNYISQNHIHHESIFFSDKDANFETNIQTLFSEINWDMDFN